MYHRVYILAEQVGENINAFRYYYFSSKAARLTCFSHILFERHSSHYNLWLNVHNLSPSDTNWLLYIKTLNLDQPAISKILFLAKWVTSKSKEWKLAKINKNLEEKKKNI